MYRVLLDMLSISAERHLAKPNMLLRDGVARARRGIRRFAKDETGATAIEYGLIITGLSIAILATVFAIGGELKTMYEMVDSKISSRAN